MIYLGSKSHKEEIITLVHDLFNNEFFMISMVHLFRSMIWIFIDKT